MRPLVLASAILLVLSGCATAEPEAQVDVANQSQSSSTPEAEGTIESGDASAPTSEPQPTESDATNQDSVADEQDDGGGSSATQEPETRETATVEEAEEPQPTQTATTTEEPSAEPEVIGYTLAEVSQKDSAAECWVVIDGGVYDLTRWIQSHPGGAGAITQLCGTDGTAQFLGQHGGQPRPSSTLDSYYLGPLR
jgi:cytochrome b involved in lipid metabolism